MRCDGCPLSNYDIENVKCVGEIKNRRYCDLKQSHEDKILKESVSLHNKRVEEEGLSPISLFSLKKFGRAMLKWAKSGQLIVPEDVYEGRITTCEGGNGKPRCDSLSEDGHCQLCTCAVRAKAAVPTEECPIKKWLAYKEVKRGGGGCNCNK